MDPQIAAALIGVGGAMVGVIGLVSGVYLTAGRAQDQRRQQLVAAALSDYMSGAAKSVSALKLEQLAESSSGALREEVLRQAVDTRLAAIEAAAQAKIQLLAYADADVVESLARWDKEPIASSSEQQRALLAMIDSVRRQLVGTKGAVVPEADRLGLMFGWR